jgi:phage FluMu gp28-like protein
MSGPDVETDMVRLLHFYPYQRRWLADKSRFKIGMFSRQTGKTFGCCAELVEDCIDAEIAGRRTRWVILSRGERQAKEAMEENVKPMTRAFWEIYRGLLNGPAPEVEEGEFRVQREDGTDASYKQFEVTYPGGSRITAVPANPDTARGFSANMLFDEFAFHQNSKAIWGAAFPVISKGWKARVVSTPNGKSNKFYDLMTENPTIWSRHETDIYKAVEEGCPRNIEELKGGLADADLWAQEYELQWRDEASAWLDYELIQACETAGVGRKRYMEFDDKRQLKTCVESGEPLPELHGPVFVGMDIARKRDLTCIWVAEQIGDVLYPREMIIMKRAPFRAQHDELKRIRDRDHPVRFSIDQTGMGEPFVETAQEYLGQYACEGVIFTPVSRWALATMLKESMEGRKLRLPVGDRELRDDLHSIAKAVSETGSVRLVHDGESDGHGDRFWAASLCVNAASGGTQLIRYQGVPKRAWDDVHSGDDTPRGMAQRSRAQARGRFGGGAW